MGTFWPMSKGATSVALDISEFALLIFGVVLVIGIVGEYAKSERWKRWLRLFEIFVTIGVSGELLADGGIFLFSSRLQTISDWEVAQLNDKAEAARLEQERLRTDNLRLTHDTEVARADAAAANERASEAEARSKDAEARAAEANQKAEQERLERVKIEEARADRRLSAEQLAAMVAKLRILPPSDVGIIRWTPSLETRRFANDICDAFEQAGWRPLLAWREQPWVNVTDLHVEADRSAGDDIDHAAREISELFRSLGFNVWDLPRGPLSAETLKELRAKSPGFQGFQGEHAAFFAPIQIWIGVHRRGY